MTGENFTRLNRHDEKLDELLEKYNSAVDAASDAKYELCQGDGTWEAYYAACDRYKILGEAIWRHVFYKTRDFNLARDYCRRNNICTIN